MSEALKRFHAEDGHLGLQEALDNPGELHAAATRLARAMPDGDGLTAMGILKILDGRTESPRPATLEKIYAAIESLAG